jgi:adenylate cyclase
VRPGRAPLLAAVAVAAVAIGAAGLQTDVLDRWELDAVDARFDLRGDRAPDPRVAVVGVDEATLQRVNRRWPFPRDRQAELVDALRRLRVRLIVYDIQITEASGDDEADLALYDAVSKARPTVLAATDTDERGRTRVFGGDENLRAAGAVAGSALLSPDYRRVPYAVGGLPTIATRVAQIVSGRPPPREDFDGEGAWIDYAGPSGTYPIVSWADVVEGREATRSRHAGRVVVVGLTAPVLQDLHETSAPGAGRMAGPEIQANAIATALRAAPLRSIGGAVDVALVALLGLLIPALALRYGLWALVPAPLAAASLLVAGQVVFSADRILTVLPPLVALAAGTGGTAAALLMTEVRQRRLLRRTLARFTPEQLIDEVLDRAESGGGRLEAVELDATVLFCDLRGFTGFAERHDVGIVIDLLNRYLAEVAEAVMANGGTVVAYLGDGVMAVFGAPVSQDDHAARALAAARELLGERIARVNAWLRERGIDAEFALGVGLHSGSVMSGMVGSDRRIEYAAVGDTTNVAARLQARTKEEHVPLLLSEATQSRLGGVDGLRPLGEVQLRGRATPLQVWTLA